MSQNPVPYVPSYTYNPLVTTGLYAPVYTLRRWMSDTDFSKVGTGIPRSSQTALFSDQEYLAFINDSGGDLVYAWSEALLAIASNRAVMSIYVNLGGGGDVDFRGVADQLMKLSQQVIDRYASIPASDYAQIDTGPIAAGRIGENVIMEQFT